MELLQEIVLELKTSFPTVVPDNPLNNNDEEIEIHNMSCESNDEAQLIMFSRLYC